MVRLTFEDGWFLQNLEKDFIRTNMHTTVARAAQFQVPIYLVQFAKSTNFLHNRYHLGAFSFLFRLYSYAASILWDSISNFVK